MEGQEVSNGSSVPENQQKEVLKVVFEIRTLLHIIIVCVLLARS